MESIYAAARKMRLLRSCRTLRPDWSTRVVNLLLTQEISPMKESPLVLPPSLPEGWGADLFFIDGYNRSVYSISSLGIVTGSCY